MKHIIAVLLENEPGALSRVVALFSARGYNIESLTVAPTEDASLSRMTVVTTGSDEVIEQITKHLNRLIEVVKVVDLTEGSFTERELMLIKVRAVGKERDEMKRMADIFRGHIVDVTDKSYTIELTGDTAKLDAFIDAVDRSWDGSIPYTLIYDRKGEIVAKLAGQQTEASFTEALRKALGGPR